RVDERDAEVALELWGSGASGLRSLRGTNIACTAADITQEHRVVAEGEAGPAIPAGGDVGWSRGEFRGVFGAGDGDRGMPVRCIGHAAGAGADPASRADGSHPPRVRAGHRTGSGIRLPGRGSVRAEQGAALQSVEAAAGAVDRK